MAKWRSARLRRLYGKPTDPIESSDDASTGPEHAGQTRGATEAAPPPPPKRVRREKTRPESEYELVHNMPVTPGPPDYSLLVNPLNEKQANTVAYAIHASRNNWLSGSMFETFWTRKPRGKKATDNQPNLRDKMTKLHECAVTLGPHTFPVKLFTVKDDNVHLDDEEDRKVEEKLAAAEKERRAEEDAKRSNVAADPKAASDEAGNSGNAPMEEPNQAQTTSLDVDEGPKPLPKAKDVDTAESSGPQPEDSMETASEKPAEETRLCEEPSSQTSSRPLEVNDVSSETGPANHEEAGTASNAAPETIPEANLTVDEMREGDSASGQGSHSAPVTEHVTEPVVSTPAVKSVTDSGESEMTGIESSESGKTATDAKPSKGRRKGRPKTTPTESAEPPASGTTDAEPSERKKSFEMEKQHLEAEKRRVEELEQQLNGTAPPKHLEASKASDASEPSVASAGGGETRVPNEQNRSPVAASPLPVPGQLPAQQAPPPPPPPALAAPRAVPNELVVSKLQQMAARDANLGELMRVVASQTASHEDIMKFQEIINRVKASIFTVPTPPPKSRAKPKPKAAPPVPRVQTHYQPRAHSKAIMLAIEFDENPTERHLLPKRSIIEYLPAEGQLLWSFIHVADDDNKQASGSEKRTRKIYTPITATFHDIPFKVAQTLERCVRKPDVVAYYMKETMANAVRSEPWYLWYCIEKNDEVLLESMKKMQAPTMAPPPPPRKPTKPRKLKAGNNASDASSHVHRRRPGEPLVQTHPMIIGRRGQPMVQPPSYYQHLRQRARNSAPRADVSAAAAGPAAVAVVAPSVAMNPGTPTWTGDPTSRSAGLQTPQRPAPAIPPATSAQGPGQPPLDLPAPTDHQMPDNGQALLPRSMQADNADALPAASQDLAEPKMEIDT